MRKNLVIGAAAVLAAALVSMNCFAEELSMSLSLPTGDRAQINAPDNYAEVSQDEFDEMDRAMRAFTPSSDSLLKNKAENFYYYSQLDEEQQGLYDCLMVLTDYPDEEDNYSLYFASKDPSSDEFLEDVFTVYLAMTYDHPELFWLYNSSKTSIAWSSVVSGEGDDTAALVMFMLTEPYTDYEKDMTAFNNAADAFMADIDTTASEEEVVRQIHDKLVDMVSYDFDTANSLFGGGESLAHTAYGALVENNGVPNYAVCDGYSLAFEYLLQQAGIECTFVGGSAGMTEDDMGGHAWNIVKIGGQWYEMDSTWDDVGGLEDAIEQLDHDSPEYQYFSEAVNDVEYHDILEHYMFGKTTSYIRNFQLEDEHYYITDDQMYRLTLLDPSVHVRDSEAMPGSAMGVVSSMTPEAVSSLD